MNVSDRHTVRAQCGSSFLERYTTDKLQTNTVSYDVFGWFLEQPERLKVKLTGQNTAVETNVSLRGKKIIIIQ